jgi:hypothetical protein
MKLSAFKTVNLYVLNDNSSCVADDSWDVNEFSKKQKVRVNNNMNREIT